MARTFRILRGAASAAVACAFATGGVGPEEDPAEGTHDSNTQAAHADSFLMRNGGNGLCLDGYAGGGNIRPYMFTCNATNPYQWWHFVSQKEAHAKYAILETASASTDSLVFFKGNPYLYQGLPANSCQ